MNAEHPALLLWGADHAHDLWRQLAELTGVNDRAGGLEGTALHALAARLTSELPRRAPVRAALVATPSTLRARLETLSGWRDEHDGAALLCGRGVAFGHGSGEPAIGLLFPGQGAPVAPDAGGIAELLPGAAAAYAAADLPSPVPDDRVQQAIAVASVTALRAVRALGIEGQVAVGHSLGELTALHWAGALDEPRLLALARARGAAMTAHASGAGAMASVVAAADTVADLVDAGVVIACANSPTQHVVSGSVEAIEAVVSRARARGVRALRLPVVGAFHSPLMAPAAPVFAEHLADVSLDPLRRRVVSTVTGEELAPDADLRALLTRQIVDPVRFAAAVRVAAPAVDLFLELGPGRILSGLVREIDPDTPAISARAGERSPEGILEVAGAAYAAGAAIRVEQLAGAGAIAPAAR